MLLFLGKFVKFGVCSIYINICCLIIKFLGKVVIIVEIWMGSWGGYGVIL